MGIATELSVLNKLIKHAGEGYGNSLTVVPTSTLLTQDTVVVIVTIVTLLA